MESLFSKTCIRALKYKFINEAAGPVECWLSTLSHGDSNIYELGLLSGHAISHNLLVPAEHFLYHSITEVAYKQWLCHCSHQLSHIVPTIFMSI
ncbi:hypothetical protein PVL29_005043 [Vitis rotundifolia]|uniref:Uncharacterized protein n=1 Tax=Vitis rotundifolia TaxID=103349 RepID=A0AA39AA87_VITRO|nr:hypothetical protein PVL29_005043 [Vitis rotundifolia]